MNAKPWDDPPLADDSQGFPLSTMGLKEIAMATLKRKKPRTEPNQRFKRLARIWKRETGLYSKVTQRAMHPAYQKIIGMGSEALPLILQDLADHGPDDWFWALTAITDENPITQKMAGDMTAMTEAWLKWGRNAGYLEGSSNRLNGSSQT